MNNLTKLSCSCVLLLSISTILLKSPDVYAQGCDYKRTQVSTGNPDHQVATLELRNIQPAYRVTIRASAGVSNVGGGEAFAMIVSYKVGLGSSYLELNRNFNTYNYLHEFRIIVTSLTDVTINVDARRHSGRNLGATIEAIVECS